MRACALLETCSRPCKAEAALADVAAARSDLLLASPTGARPLETAARCRRRYPAAWSRRERLAPALLEDDEARGREVERAVGVECAVDGAAVREAVEGRTRVVMRDLDEVEAAGRPSSAVLDEVVALAPLGP